MIRSLRRYRFVLLAWRAYCLLLFVLQHITPRSWWSRHVVPGAIVVATTNHDAMNAIERSIRAQSGWPFRVRNSIRLHQLVPSEDPELPRRGRPAVWQLQVARGNERAVIRELEHRVADELARSGGYEGVGAPLALELARFAMVAHPCRQVRPAGGGRFQPSARVEFVDEVHDAYAAMIQCDGPRNEVVVTVLDERVDPDHVWKAREDQVTSILTVAGDVDVPAGAHGAVTASIIARMAPESTIEAHPVMSPLLARGQELHGEGAIASALLLAKGDLIVLCLALDDPALLFNKSYQTTVEVVAAALAPTKLLVVATGNRENPSRDQPFATFPATLPQVLAVGAVTRDGAVPLYSRYQFAKGKPAPAFLVAPGGGDRVGRETPEHSVAAGGQAFVGTSVAAAYAAGAIARWMGTSACVPGRPAAERIDALVKAAFMPAGGDKSKLGAGIIRQPGGASATGAVPSPASPSSDG